MMMLKANSQEFLAEAAVAASALPCSRRTDAMCWSGYVVAFAGSCAR
jgi:hypothetical protein